MQATTQLAPKKYVLALDQGTTSSRAILFDQTGAICGVAQAEFQQIFPQPGWVEHNPEEIWRSQLDCIRRVLQQANVAATEIAALGITNQRETAVLWERASGRPLANAIVWQDRRTADECLRLKQQGLEHQITQRTGLLLDPYFSATKVAWLLDHVPGARARAERGELAFGTIDSWLIWKLTEGSQHLTDISNASRTLLVNLKTLDWDDWLLERLRVPKAVLPRIVASSGVCTMTSNTVVGAEIPIAGIAGDQQAATFGQACFKPGMAKNTYGTGCFLLMNTASEPKFSTQRLLTTVAWQLERSGARAANYALEGSVFIGGAVVQWLRDSLRLIARSEDVETLACSVPDAGGVQFVPAFAGLGAPYWDPQARGLLIGLTRGTQPGHIARAALEAIALQSADVLQAMQRDTPQPLIELRVDGGAARNDALMQFQADVIGVPVLRPLVTETTALGVAYLAGLAVGVWQNLDEIASRWRAERRFEPRWSQDQREARLHNWQRAVERARDWAQ